MAWPTRELGTLATITRGSSPRPIADTRYFENGTIPWIKIADATKSGKYLYKTKEYVNEYGASFSRRLPPKTILVAASGTLGYTQILGVEGCAHDGWLIIQELNGLDRDFAYYALKTLERHFFNSAYGAAIQNINTEILRKTEIPYPSLPIQRRIGSILSAYDDLIENITSRIAILEEMARRLYEEWFVHFRFPGHEQVRMIESELGLIPEGWAIEPLGEFCNVTDYVANGSFASLKQNVTYRDEPDYAVLVRGTDFKSGWNGEYVYVTEHSYRFLKKSSLLPGDIVVTNVGNIGTTFMVPKLGRPMTLGPNSVLARPRNGTAFLFHYLRSDEGQHRIHGITSGAAQPKFNKTEFRALRIVIPSDPVLAEFERLLSPVHALGEKLRAASKNLSTQRDLLLPKLISGEIDVSAFPEAEVVAA